MENQGWSLLTNSTFGALGKEAMGTKTAGNLLTVESQTWLFVIFYFVALLPLATSLPLPLLSSSSLLAFPLFHGPLLRRAREWTLEDEHLTILLRWHPRPEKRNWIAVNSWRQTEHLSIFLWWSILLFSSFFSFPFMFSFGKSSQAERSLLFCQQLTQYSITVGFF